MNETEHLPSPASDMGNQIEALQRQVFLLLLALVVMSATVVFYLFCQSHFLSTDLDQLRPQAVQVISAYNTNRQKIEGFHQALNEYAATHPTFGQRVLAKYGWTPTTNALKP